MKIAYIRPDIRFNLPEQYVQFNEACPNCDPEDGLIREVDQEGTVRYHNSNNLLHREDGPAVEYSNGDRVWYLGGRLHREDGPAVERPDGIRFWYLDGKRLSEDEFEARKPARKIDDTLSGSVSYHTDSLRVRTLLHRLKKARY